MHFLTHKAPILMAITFAFALALWLLFKAWKRANRAVKNHQLLIDYAQEAQTLFDGAEPTPGRVVFKDLHDWWIWAGGRLRLVSRPSWKINILLFKLGQSAEEKAVERGVPWTSLKETRTINLRGQTITFLAAFPPNMQIRFQMGNVRRHAKRAVAPIFAGLLTVFYLLATYFLVFT